MKTFARILVGLLFIGITARSQTVDPTLAARLQQALDSLRIANGLPGLTAALILPDGSIWKGASNLTTNDLIGVASITKAIMATLTMKLVEEGTLHLDDSLYMYLPKMTNIDSTVTIRQLLGMRAGVADFWSYPNFPRGVLAAATTRMTTSEILSYVGTPLFAPGAGFEYVNTNYLLMQMIIESKTGRQIQDLLRERFWTPLGLSRTYYYGRDSLVPPVAPGHHFSSFWESKMTSHFDRVFSAFSGCGNVFTTMEDIARFVRAVYGDTTVISAASRREMTRYYPVGGNLFPGYIDPYTGYGLGTVSLSYAGYTSMGHDGGLFAYFSRALHFPELGVTMALGYNYMDDDEPRFMKLYSSFFDVYLKLSQRPALPPRRSLIVAGGIRDSGTVYEVDPSTFAHWFIGRNYYADIAGVRQAKDGYLYALMSDLGGWHVSKWNGTTSKGLTIVRMPTFYNAPLSGLTLRTDTTCIFSYYANLNELNLKNGESTLLKTLFPGTPTITGITVSPVSSELWISVNKGGKGSTGQFDFIYRVNPTSWDTTFVGSAGLGVQLNDIAFKPDGTLYGVTADSLARLVRINQTTGQATVVATLNLRDARALAFTGDIGTSGVQLVLNEVPRGYLLSQNYPNPFNPSTVIRYQLPVSSKVSLKVYDVLGQEVAVLVNEEQHAGVYQANWNAAVSSGVYFYRLEAVGKDGKSFVETKKMLLVR